MPTISLPTTGTSNWGEPLNNYIGQIQDNNQGGTLNTFTSTTNLTPASKAQGYTYVHTNNSQIRATNVDTNATPTNTQSNLLLQGVPQGGTTGDLLAQTASGVPSWASASGIGGNTFPYNLTGVPVSFLVFSNYATSPFSSTGNTTYTVPAGKTLYILALTHLIDVGTYYVLSTIPSGRDNGLVGTTPKLVDISLVTNYMTPTIIGSDLSAYLTISDYPIHAFGVSLVYPQTVPVVFDTFKQFNPAFMVKENTILKNNGTGAKVIVEYVQANGGTTTQYHRTCVSVHGYLV